MKYTQEMMGYLNLFENITKARAKDCILGDKITFIVERGYIGMAIGKGGMNIKNLERLLKKKIRLIEFNDNVIEFVKNVIQVKPKDIYMENNVLNISIDSIKEKGIVIGRNKKNLNELKEIISNYFKVEDIKIL